MVLRSTTEVPAAVPRLALDAATGLARESFGRRSHNANRASLGRDAREKAQDSTKGQGGSSARQDLSPPYAKAQCLRPLQPSREIHKAILQNSH